MNIAAISLSPEGARLADRLQRALDPLDCYVHRLVRGHPRATRFTRLADLTARVFTAYERLIFIAPCGAVIRALAPHIRHKTRDPGVVVLDVGGRYAISLLGGHEGGANALAVQIANILGAEPVISTTTEARKTVIVGVGCRKGAPAARIEAAVRQAIERAGVTLADVRWLATAAIKREEHGLWAAARALNLPLRLIAMDAIRHAPVAFATSAFVQKKIGLPAVAEPAALLAGRRTQLLLPRQIVGGVTVAVAREHCTSSA